MKILERRISRPRLEKCSSNEPYTPWIYTNKQKEKNLNNEFINRIEALDKEYISLNILEIRIRLCNNNSRKEYFSKRYDPFLSGSYRRTIYKSFSPSITLIENFIKKLGINRIHGMLFPITDYDQRTNRCDKKLVSREIVDFLMFISKFVNESGSINLRKLSLFSEGRIDLEKRAKHFQYLLTKISTDTSIKAIKTKKLSKKIPRRSYKLITEFEQQSGQYYSYDSQIRSRKSKRLVIFSTNKGPRHHPRNEVALIRYSRKSDFRRGIIKGSIRAQRRKIVIWELFQAKVHSPLFFDRIQEYPPFSFDVSEWIKLIFRNWVGKEEGETILEYTEEQTKIEEKEQKNKRRKKVQIGMTEPSNPIPLMQLVRSCMLLIHSIFRKYILLPSFIIAKNIGRIFLLQVPEWSEDFKEWSNEIHVKCTYNGVPLSKIEFSTNWLRDGIQIKVLFPFRLKPWHKSKLRSSQKHLMKKKKEGGDSYFLTFLGIETEPVFGSRGKRTSFFKPIFKELEKKIVKFKFKKKYFRSKETKINPFLKKILKEFSKVNPILRLREVEVYESTKIKEEKDSIINNQIIYESFSQITYPNWKSLHIRILTEKNMKNRTDRTSRLQNQIERITKEKKKVTPAINNLSPNKTSYNAKRFEKWKILKRRNARLICKLPLFLNFFTEEMYTDLFLSIINIPKIRMNTEFFFKSKNKILDKSIYNNQKKQGRIKKKNKRAIPFISTIKNDSNTKRNSHIFYNLSYMSQTYVFYRFSQLQVSNSSKLRSILQYQAIPLFLKPEIKDSFETHGMVHSKLEYKKFTSYEINQWKNWLRVHFQYDLSKIRWSRLVPEKWRNVVHQRRIAKKENVNKWHSYEKKTIN